MQGFTWENRREPATLLKHALEPDADAIIN